MDDASHSSYVNDDIRRDGRLLGTTRDIFTNMD